MAHVRPSLIAGNVLYELRGVPPGPWSQPQAEQLLACCEAALRWASRLQSAAAVDTDLTPELTAATVGTAEHAATQGVRYCLQWLESVDQLPEEAAERLLARLAALAGTARKASLWWSLADGTKVLAEARAEQEDLTVEARLLELLCSCIEAARHAAALAANPAESFDRCVLARGTGWC